MNSEVYLMDEERQDFWKRRGVEVVVGWWYFEVGGRIYGHFTTQREAEINRDCIMRRVETGCASGVCE